MRPVLLTARALMRPETSWRSPVVRPGCTTGCGPSGDQAAGAAAAARTEEDELRTPETWCARPALVAAAARYLAAASGLNGLVPARSRDSMKRSRAFW